MQLGYPHWSAQHCNVKSKGVLCYFESKTAFSWPAAVNHFKHMFTWLLLPTHVQLSPAPTEHNNKHLALPQRGDWKRAGCMERSGSFKNTTHTASLKFLSGNSSFHPTTTCSVDFQVQILLWIITKGIRKSTGEKKSARVYLLLTEYIYSVKATNCSWRQCSLT